MSNHMELHEDYAYYVYQDNNIVPVNNDSSNFIFIRYRVKGKVLNYRLLEETGELLFDTLPDFDSLPVPMKVKSYAGSAHHFSTPDKAWCNISYMLSKINIPLYGQSDIICDINRKVDHAISRALDANNRIGIVVNILHVKYEPCYDDEVEEEDIVARVAAMSMEDRPNDQFVPAAKLSIESLKKLKFEGSNENCPICLEEILKGSEVTSMPCLHVYHGDCIITWLQTSHKCPLCRFELPTTSS